MPGEDMELVAKLHAYCRNNLERYSIRYEPNAVCWSQVPSTLPDLFKQRRLSLISSDSMLLLAIGKIKGHGEPSNGSGTAMPVKDPLPQIFLHNHPLLSFEFR